MVESARSYDVHRDTPNTHTFGDYAYDAIYIGGIGGGMIALYFLVVDIAMHGQAFFTPSLMGLVLFNGVPAHSVNTVDMIAVAKFSVLHFALFGVLGIALSAMVHQIEIHARNPLLVMLILFGVLEAGFWLSVTMGLPGVLDRIGAVNVAIANLLSALGVTLFLMFVHRRRGRPNPE
jgi:hypothetical protein